MSLPLQQYNEIQKHAKDVFKKDHKDPTDT